MFGGYYFGGNEYGAKKQGILSVIISNAVTAIASIFKSAIESPNPIISFTYQNNSTLPSPLPYSTTIATESQLPVLVGEPSDHITFRVYNNYGCLPYIPQIYNVQIQTFDTINLTSQSTQPVMQNWLHLQQTGFGENSISPAQYTAYYEATDTAVGGSTSSYIPSWGSSGGSTALINAGSGCGMLEFDSYISIPINASVNNSNYGMVLGIIFDWTAE